MKDTLGVEAGGKDSVGQGHFGEPQKVRLTKRQQAAGVSRRLVWV